MIFSFFITTWKCAKLNELEKVIAAMTSTFRNHSTSTGLVCKSSDFRFGCHV